MESKKETKKQKKRDKLDTLIKETVAQQVNDQKKVIENMVAQADKDKATIIEMNTKITELSKMVANKQDSFDVAEKMESFFVKKHENRVKAFRESQEKKRERTQEEEFCSDEIFYDKWDNVDVVTIFPENIQRELDKILGVIGQKHLKEHFEKLCYMRIKQQRLLELDPKGTNGPNSYHMVFRGNPGTGKTMLAGLVGNLLKALKIVPTTKFKVVQLHEMKAKYLGQTPHLMAEIFKEPGVYFIDEAYSIIQREDDSYGKEILAALCEMLENRRHEVVVIMAGYKKDMIELFNYNPGLESRFHWIFDFHDYTQDDLIDIATYTTKKNQDTFTAEALKELRNDLTAGTNARDVRNIIEEIGFCQAVRTCKCATYTLDFLRTIEVADVLQARSQRKYIAEDVDVANKNNDYHHLQMQMK